jgi:hypothetical protein
LALRQSCERERVDKNAVSASFKNAVLTVTVPKSAQAVERTKRIPINAGSKSESEGKSR